MGTHVRPALCFAGPPPPAASVARCLDASLGAALAAVAVYGSGADGTYIRGFSDLDLAVFHEGPLEPPQLLEIHRRLTDVAVEPFAYLQLKFLDVLGPPQPAFVPGQFEIIHGSMTDPRAWQWSARALRRSSAKIVDGLPGLTLELTHDWSSAIGAREGREIRRLFTYVKPALRASLVALGEEALAVWSAPIDDLAALLRRYDAVAAAPFGRLVRRLPVVRGDETAAGETLIELLGRLTELTATVAAPADSAAA
jgi:Nucleotidyltransferase domain